MNVYDFDGTIYAGDSTVDFFLHALKTKPSLLRYFPKQAAGFVLYGLKQINKTQFKEYFFSFLSAIDADELTESFWNRNQHKIYDWYLAQQEPEDIVISASPEFLLRPICRRLNINYLIASRVDPHSGKYFGENCHGQEKARRLAAEHDITHINKFYSDSNSDLPLARMAEEAFFVRKGTLKIWEGVKNQ